MSTHRLEVTYSKCGCRTVLHSGRVLVQEMCPDCELGVLELIAHALAEAKPESGSDQRPLF